MRFILLRTGRVIDLEDKQISSWHYVPYEEAISDEWGCEEAFYEVYYFDEDKGMHLERDGKGGHSMDCFNESEVLRKGDTLEEVVNRYIKSKGCPREILSKYQFEKMPMAKLKEEMAKGNDFYGAIWLRGEHGEPILSSIGKVNKDGGLELL